ncbi:Prophage integrase IntA [Labrys miyagiensis]
MSLTDTAVRNAKPGDKPRKLTDEDGLHLLIKPNGSKLWRLNYRFDGKQKTLALGAYPTRSLAEAREKRKEARRLLQDGTDPSVRRKLDRVEEAIVRGNTFRLIADEFLAKMEREKRAEATLEKTRWLLSLASDLDQRPISEVTAAEILAVLRTVEKRGRLESARRLRSTIGAVFRYAIATARAEDDPTYALRGALTTPVVKHRAAVTDPKEFGALLRAVWGFEGQPTTCAALKLMAYLFPRPGELRMAEWSEFDLDAATWTVPASRMKMRRPHATHLPVQAVTILRELHNLTGRGKLVFPATTSVLRSISENTVNSALRRLGYTKDEATGHGFRASASTMLNESGRWSSDAVERQLAHVDADDVRRAYARGAHWDERVKMLDWWAERVDALREGAKIIELPRAAR